MQMLWVRDVVGVFVKGMIFGFVGGWFACYEGLRGPSDVLGSPDPLVDSRASRSGPTCLAGVAILVINSAWFLLLYHAGPAFGPTCSWPPPQL